MGELSGNAAGSGCDQDRFGCWDASRWCRPRARPSTTEERSDRRQGGPAVGEGNGNPTLGVGGPTAGRDSSAGAVAGSGALVAGRDGRDAAVEGRAGAGRRSSGSSEPSASGETAAPSGRHAATDRTQFRPSPSSPNPGHVGRRHRPDPETSARPVEVPDTDGLGLADLLAGALADFRGI